MDLQLRSSAFEGGKAIPARFTCEGDNVSPPLTWVGASADVKSFVLICDDPDAARGTFTHWVLYDIPGEATELEEGFGNATTGRNDFGNAKYDGPCPPNGDQPHRYYFRLYALSKALNIPPGMTRAQVLDRISDAILARSELIGTYGRS